MENNGYHLDIFTKCLLQYFNGVLIHKNYVSTSFRKYYLKDGEDAEFSFQIKPSTCKTDCDKQLLSQESNSACFTKEDFEKLINSSKLWPLHLADVSIKESKLLFKLDQLQAISNVIKFILNEQSRYGLNFLISQGVTIEINEGSVEDLTQLRLRLLKRTADNIINSVQVQDTSNSVQVCLTIKPLNNSKLNAVCGVVVNSVTKTKETQVTPEDYYNIQLSNVRMMSQHKYWEIENEELMHHVADACVKMALLEVNPKRTVSLIINPNGSEVQGSMSKGASFVLYNYARLASIRKTFEEQCSDNIYPDMPSLDDLDFSLLKEKEEWIILFNYLLEYPTMIRKITDDLQKGIFSCNQICRFLSGLSSIYSVYYRRVRVLLEPKEHLLPLIFVRLQFLRAIEQVIENGLSLIDIKVVEEM